MKRHLIALISMMATCSLACAACSDGGDELLEGNQPSTSENNESPEAGGGTAVTDVEMTTAVPDAFFQAASQQGTVEVLNYVSRDYAGNGDVTSKPAYVYLPYGYDSNKKYDIIYLIHGWTGRAQDYFGTSSYPQMKNIFDHLIEQGLTRPFIAVSPTWDKDNQSKDWSESTREVAAFYQEYENDLIPAVESHYSTYAETTDHAGIVASRDHRAFGGFSLGSITTWYIFEHVFDLQKWFLPMSGDNWHVAMFGGASYPDETAAFLKTVVDGSDYKDNFYVWYAVGTNDSRFAQTENQARAMMKLTDTFNSQNFSYHQKAGGVHDMRAVWEFVYNAMPFFYPATDASGVEAVRIENPRRSVDTAYTLSGQVATEGTRGVVIVNGKKVLR